MKLNVSRTEVFRIVCPRCDAKQWEYCKNSDGFYMPNGGILHAFHVTRIRKAERLRFVRAQGFIHLEFKSK